MILVDNSSRPALAASALLAGLCPLVADSVYEDEAGSGSEILAVASDGPPAAAYVANGLFLVGFVALMTALGLLAVAIGRRSPVAAVVAAVAGSAAVAVKLSEVTTGMALRQQPDALDAGTAEFLVAVDDAGFVLYGFLLSVSFAAVGVGLLRAEGVPRWLAWWPLVVGTLGVPTAAVGILVVGAYVPVPFLLLLVWLVVLGIVVVRRPVGRTAFVEAAATTE